MKLTIAMFSLVLSANVFAYSLGDSTVLTSAAPLLSSVSTSGGLEKAEANLVLNDAQELSLSGTMSVFLSQKINEVQEINNEASVADALEVLVSEAEAILK